MAETLRRLCASRNCWDLSMDRPPIHPWSPTTVSLPGRERQAALALVEAAEQVCPFSRATRANIDFTISIVKPVLYERHVVERSGAMSSAFIPSPRWREWARVL